jgi:two-component system, OmpR family, sensor kinase
MSIRLRLTIWLTALLAVVLTALALTVNIVIADQMTSRLDANLRQRAEELDIQLHLDNDRSRGEGPPGSPCVPGQAELTSVLVNGNSILFEVYDQCGNAVTRSSNLTESLGMSLLFVQRVNRGDVQSLTRTVSGAGQLRIAGVPLGDEAHDTQALFVATPTAALKHDIVEMRILLVAIVIGTTMLSALIGWFLAAKAMQPVDEITRAAHAIGHTANIAERVPEPATRDEIGRLALTFNEMLDRLQAVITTQRQFLADASHELRSPLTAIRANVETVRRGGDGDPAERNETLRIVEREVDRMGRLVDDLLSLARADAGSAVEKNRLALDALLLEVYHQQRPLAGGVRLALGTFQPVEIDGDSDRIKQLLINLIDNALRYTPAGGHVTIDLIHRDREAIVRVQDTGPGIPEEDLPHIFERFYRVDSARARQSGGTGLGLAISREIVEAHGGRIEAASSPGAGSLFTVVLPSPSQLPTTAVEDDEADDEPGDEL